MAKKSHMMEKVGSWAFIIGVVIALLLGIFGDFSATIVSILIVLGLIVGLLNVTSHETSGFLIAAVSLVIVSAFGGNVFGSVQGIGAFLSSTLAALITFVVPATVIVALRAIWATARS